MFNQDSYIKSDNIKTFAFQGLNALLVEVEVHILPGFPSMTIIGLVDKIINESKERVKAAIHSLGLSISDKKILVNLSPANVLKEGSHFDLAISAAVLCAMGILPKDQLADYILIGELSLNGRVLHSSGVLAAAIEANSLGLGLICSETCGLEANWSGNPDILLVNNLINLINHFKGTQVISKKSFSLQIENPVYPDFSDVKCQDNVKRALQVAASGGHNVLMSGPPGTGKSMLAHRFCGILPEMTNLEMLECTMIYSAADMLKDGKIKTTRPFRNPHHSATLTSITGGGNGNKVKPGEISLAHNGVLFLDEFPEFNRNAIDSLRQPLESRAIQISRANFKLVYPANFQLIAAMNPCKCGYVEDPARSCSKAPRCSSDYQSKISGPIMDRIDIHVSVPSIDVWTLRGSSSPEISSKDLLRQVLTAHEVQSRRYFGHHIKKNSELSGQLLTDYTNVSESGMKMLNEYAKKNKLSARSYDSILKVSRTIADMENKITIDELHVSESISYRKID